MSTNSDDKYDLPDSPYSVGFTEAKQVLLATEENPFFLETGGVLFPIYVEYETYGTLNEKASNAILITHALSGDAHVAGWSSDWKKKQRPWNAKKPGWWDSVVGPHKAIDTTRYFVICSNVLGGCAGTTGPQSINPKTNKPYGKDFPAITVGDWVNLQARLIDYLGIQKLFAVLGGSLGGQQVLEWSLAYPNRLENAAILATAGRLSPQGLGFNAVGRQAILTDAYYNNGDYYSQTKRPDAGLAAARMLAHITYLSPTSMNKKFGRRLQNKKNPDYDFSIEFQVESYLSHQGKSFVERFDANSYLYITRAMDFYDVAKRWGEGSLLEAVKKIQCRVLVLTFSSDWLYSPAEGRELAEAIAANGKEVSYLSLTTDKGHDAFLLEVDQVSAILKAFFSGGCNEYEK